MKKALSLLSHFSLCALAAHVLSSGAAAQGSCPIPSYGKTCGTTALGEHELLPSGRRITVRFATSPQTQVGLIVVGNALVSVGVPGGCELYVKPQLTLPAAFTLGSFRWQFDLPADRVLLPTYLQMAALELRGSAVIARTSNALQLGPWLGVQSFVEDFQTRDGLDLARSTLVQSDKGELELDPFVVGDELGDFDPAIGGRDTGLKDGAGRAIFEWDTDLIVIPASRTRSGTEARVTDGVLPFRRFRLAKDVRLRFVGKNPVRISAAEELVVEGVIDASGATAPRMEGFGGRPPRVGQDGARGGPGGGVGGRGGDSPHAPQPKVDGSAGDSPVVQGHVHAADLATRGGLGSRAFPQPPVDASVQFSAFSNVICQTVTSGGSGANFALRGGTGVTVRNLAGTEPPQAFDFGPPTAPSRGSIPFYYLNLPSSVPTIDHFMVPGAGGGGAGAHPSSAYDASGFEPVNWTPGHGGSGGGGALALRSAARVVLASGAELLARGGDGLVYPVDTRNFTNPAPGGAGSGGSVVIQSITAPILQGLVDVRGGGAGHYQSDQYKLSVDAKSGEGSPGLIRIESIQTVDASKATLHPNVPLMLGTVRKSDILTAGVAYSKWIDVGRFPQAWHHAVLTTTTNASPPLRYSDNPSFGAGFTTEFRVEFQGATLAPDGSVIGNPSAWSDKLSSLNAAAPSLNGVRYRIVLDNGTRPSDRLAVQSIALFYDC